VKARDAAALRELTQAERLQRFGEIQDERLALETKLLHLDAEEARLMAQCEHTTEEGEQLDEPICPLCGGNLG
jgi:hypothetical protein